MSDNVMQYITRRAVTMPHGCGNQHCSSACVSCPARDTVKAPRN
jgi:hypothetical protein